MLITDPHTGRVSILYEQHSDDSDSDSDDYLLPTNPVHLALLHSDLNALKEALAAEKIDGTNINEICITQMDLHPLHLAFISGTSTDCIMALLDMGADLLKECPLTPTDYAISASCDSMLCQFIEEYRAKFPDIVKEMLNKPSCIGYTPLHRTFLRGNVSKRLVQLMLDSGALASCPSRNGVLPSQMCKDEEVKSLLLKHEMLEKSITAKTHKRELNNDNTDANNKRMKLSENDVPLSGSRGINDSSTAQASELARISSC